MNEPKVLEIHEIQEVMLDKRLYNSFDVLTFDDCLYSQYLYFDFYKNLAKPLIFLLSTGIYRRETQTKILKSDKAHKLAIKSKNFSGFMSLQELAELSKNAVIGLHGHNHKYINDLKAIQQLRTVMDEVDLMLENRPEFTSWHFQAPYDYGEDLYLKAFKHRGIQVQCYRNRVQIETLLDIDNGKQWLNRGL